MSQGVRSGLAALALCLVLGIPVASAQTAPTSRTWTDPPARQPEAEKPAAEAPRAAAAPSPTPAAAAERSASKAASPGAQPRKATVRREKPVRAVAAAEPRAVRKAVARPEPQARTRAAVRPRPMREARAPRIVREPPRRVAAVRPPGDERFLGYRGYGAGHPFDYADDRLERLRAAEAAGYLVVRRRSVEFPDGRSLRTYRPLEDGGYD